MIRPLSAPGQPKAGASRRSPFALVRDAVLGWLLIAVGFIAWGVYAQSLGLGYLPLDAQHYVLAALFTLAYVALAVTISFIARWLAGLASSRIARVTPGWVRVTGLFAAVVAIVSFVLIQLGFPPGIKMTMAVAFVLMGGLATLGCAKRLRDGVNRLISGATVLILCPAGFLVWKMAENLQPTRFQWILGIMMMTVSSFALLPTMKLVRKQKTFRFAKDTGRARLQIPVGRAWILEAPLQSMLTVLLLVLPCAAAGIGFSTLPHFPASLGGGEPRHAYIVGIPSHFDSLVRSSIFPTAKNPGSPTESVLLTIYYRTDSWLFVRVASDDTPASRSFELDSTLVSSVRWTN